MNKLDKLAHPLKIASGVLAVVGWLVANELQKRELREAVNEELDKREAAKRQPPK